MPLIQTLPDCPLDIVGDVHGQFEALQNLIHYLGYTPEGRHPQGRKLVFVGDLVDRGPDSPAVVSWFAQAHSAGNALMVLGNHEINLIAHEPKDGSGWFFNNRAERDSANYAPWQRQPENGKAALLRLLGDQPLILQRNDLRIVHAAWLPQAAERLKEADNQDIGTLMQDWDDEMHCCIRHAPWFDEYLAEQRKHAHQLEDPTSPPPMLPATAAHDIYRSNKHPIRALTCGVEKIATEPFFAGGRWRFSIRNPWWQDYRGNTATVVGHYWRHWKSQHQPKHRQGMFTVPGSHWHGARKNVFCIDFSVGARWRDRKRGIPPSRSEHRLAALRYPEKILVFDNGDIAKTIGG